MKSIEEVIIMFILTSVCFILSSLYFMTDKIKAKYIILIFEIMIFIGFILVLINK